MKWRNSKERELLSSGGSRESTLPVKGNDGQNCEQSPLAELNGDESITEKDGDESINNLEDSEFSGDLSIDLEQPESNFSNSESSDSDEEIDVS